ncbi:TetR/AcrR family transcriptional regulator [Anaerotalea alkaliphila]|uniref:TetR/AcrR family transcriptional regulator n=1 Tax=Anaerotalea alkaliphila TaxID=2662126 RepID=A0A7X5HUN2_9FIRM|nr:TetR/AcrR family transcriptional regulator [Anaerotalea alkaliphila]NDL66954.1 TetR/AcrR family transcriptional regulator [Anaerotalea alkaliphila]
MRRKVIRPEEILETAGALVREEGLAACSMRGIASRLGVAVGTLYNYFPSRDLLLQELFKASWARTVEKVRTEAERDGDGRKRILSIARILLEDMWDRKGLGREVLGFRERMGDQGCAFDEIKEAVTAALARVLKDILPPGQAEDAPTLARWTLAVLLDTIIGDRPFGPREEELLLRLVP